MSTERYTISGEDLIDRVKKLVHEGNIRRIRLIHDKKVLVDIPLTVGASAAAVTVLALPVLAAVGAIAALVNSVTIEIEKEDAAPGSTPETGPK
jgi:hypothetical protein